MKPTWIMSDILNLPLGINMFGIINDSMFLLEWMIESILTCNWVLRNNQGNCDWWTISLDKDMIVDKVLSTLECDQIPCTA